MAEQTLTATFYLSSIVITAIVYMLTSVIKEWLKQRHPDKAAQIDKASTEQTAHMLLQLEVIEPLGSLIKRLEERDEIDKEFLKRLQDMKIEMKSVDTGIEVNSTLPIVPIVENHDSDSLPTNNDVLIGFSERSMEMLTELTHLKAEIFQFTDGFNTSLNGLKDEIIKRLDTLESIGCHPVRLEELNSHVDESKIDVSKLNPSEFTHMPATISIDPEGIVSCANCEKRIDRCRCDECPHKPKEVTGTYVDDEHTVAVSELEPATIAKEIGPGYIPINPNNPCQTCGAVACQDKTHA